MTDILIFAGTTEGRELAAWLASKDVHCTVSVATEYGSLIMTPDEHIEIHQGRMNREQMSLLCKKRQYSCVVDATHPFARIVSQEILHACRESSVPYLRLLRRCENGNAPAVYFSSIKEAAAWLNERNGVIFITTGCKELETIAQCIDNVDRLYARVLPSTESIESCTRCGIAGKHVIAMQGPFSKDLNAALMKEMHASYMLTKETGLAGGYAEKLAAAQECGCTAVVIRNPERADDGDTDALDFFQTLERIQALTGKAVVPDRKKTLVLAGIGTGNEGLLTFEVLHALQDADVVFGAPSVLQHRFFRESSLNATIVPYYTPEQISEYLSYHPEYAKPVAVFSGDVGFYSGAQAFYRQEKQLPFAIQSLTGISSVAYFAAKLKKNWHDWHLVSCHGRSVDYINAFRRYKASLLIVSNVRQVNDIGRNIEHAVGCGVLGLVNIYVGYQLSCADECVHRMSASDMQALHEEGLYILLVEHARHEHSSMNVVYGLDDSLFVRSTVPMTKRDMRTLILSRLELASDSVVYDIGCGTGSVTVEAARICTDGCVYAVDCNEEAVRLTEQNCKKFCLDTVHVVQGMAPECLDSLPSPSHVFIGGSNGAVMDIMQCVLKKNAGVRIVISVVTLETLCHVQNALKSLAVTDIDIMQASISRAEQMGEYHLMKAQNPVFIVSCNGKPLCHGRK